MRIVVSLVLIALLGSHLCPAAASNVGMQVGFGQRVHSYSADNATGSRSSADRIDELSGRTQVNYDFFGGRLGNLRFDADYADLYLNHYPNSETGPGLPYSEGAGAEQGERFFYDYKGSVDLKLPRQKFRLRYQSDSAKELSPDEDVYFNSLNRITNNYDPLRGVTRSLGEYEWQRLESLRLHFYGDTVGILSDNLDIDMFNHSATDDYLTDRKRWQGGFALRPLHLGAFSELEKERFSEGQGDRDDRFVRYGLLNEFGHKNPVDFGRFRLTASYEDGDITYRGIEHNNDLGSMTLVYDRLPWKITNRINTADSEDIYTGDESVRRSWGGGIARKTRTSTTELQGFLETDSRTTNDDRVSSLSFADLNNSLISGGVSGSGTLELTALSSTVIIDLSNLEIDGDPWAGPTPVIIDPGDTYTISFDTNIQAVSTLSLDDPLMEDDFIAAINRSLSASYDRVTRRVEASHRWRGSPAFTSSFRSSYEEVMLEDVEVVRGSFTLPSNTRNVRAVEEMQIRPAGLIFDVKADFARTVTGEDSYDKVSATLKDGVYTPELRLYLQSMRSITSGDGYDDVEDTRLKLVYERLLPRNSLRLYPEWRRETVEDDSTRTSRILEARYEYGAHTVSAYLRRERETGEVADYVINRSQDRAEYRYSTRPVLMGLNYRHHDDVFTLTSYSAFLTTRRFRVYPAEEAYLVSQLNVYRDILYPGQTNERVEDYIIEKLTFTPTRRLKVILALEWQIEEDDDARDYEYGIEYATRAFKIATGYRTARTERDGDVTDEEIWYFEIRRSVGAGRFVTNDR